MKPGIVGGITSVTWYSIKPKGGSVFAHKYQMNDILKDTISGLTGQVMVIAFYGSGCIHYGLSPRKVKEDGTVVEWSWLDEYRLIRVKPAKKQKPRKAVGGPAPHPKMY